MDIQNKFLKDAFPYLKRLVAKLQEKYTYVSVLGVASKAKGYGVSKNGKTASANLMHSKNGFVLRVFKDGNYGEYSFNSVDEESVDKLAVKIPEILEPLTALPKGLEQGDRKQQDDEPLVKSFSVDSPAPSELSDQVFLEKLEELRQEAFSLSDKVYDLSCHADYRIYDKLFISKNRELYQHVYWQTLSVVALGKRGQEIKDYYKGFSSFGKSDLFERAKKAIPDVVKGLEDVLSSSPMIPGEFDCICSPDVTGMIVHEAFGHGVEEDMFVKDRALASRFLGEYVASPLVTMHDGANAQYDECASYFFDDEGVLAHDTVIIDKGVLVSGINDTLSALSLNFPSTGNGRRESYERKAYTRMTNTYFDGGKDKLEDMIASIDYGFMLENASSGMEDPKNWGIQCVVNVAREIKNGKFTGKVYSPVMLTGYVPDLLKSISMMSEVPELCGTGYCGKGYKEWVKVSDGGPYIKAKIRLG